ncbi:hypothetical protein QR680_002243 [Steinernema hermaphroditum]|uniref:Tr-type G domain-containing protein n=1 Tax=Steinernema hermaphroditum TaxID=289476 RepID=A0AA39H437_9BILA|nr:hypothetical protein QR680_002243 [Steinernema hermaphroditum]
MLQEDSMEQAASTLFGDDDDATLDIENKLTFVEDKEPPQLLDKFFLLNPSSKAISRYLELVKELLIKGDGEALIEIGYSWEGNSNEKGLPLQDLEKAIDNNTQILVGNGFIVNSHATLLAGNDLYTKMVLVRQPFDDVDFIEVRVAVVGNVDAGKSTLLGVLTHGVLDDGRGHARQKLFRHKHEFESGRTSSVGNDILGFNIRGEVVNKPDPHKHQLDWVNICREAAKVVTFIDLAGHEKYLKTTIFGMTGHMPDYTMLMIGANAGIIGTTREHLSLALSLGVPVFIVVTKIDMCPKPVLEETLKNLNKLMKSARKRPVLIANSEDVVHAATNFTSAKICPVFQVSNVAGTNLPLLKEFLNIVPLHRTFSATNPTEFQIDDIYWVDGVGTVVSGTCLSGKISLGDNLQLGPNSIGEFVPVPIKSIHRKRMPVTTVKCGQTASFALRKQTKKDVRKGMVLVSPEVTPQSCYQFDAEVLILHHPTTIATNYQAMVHVGSVRQTATIIALDKDVLRTGDRGVATFKFIRQPEYLRIGTKMVFREGRTKAVGTIMKIHPHQSAIASAKSARHHKKKELHQHKRNVSQKMNGMQEQVNSAMESAKEAAHTVGEKVSNFLQGNPFETAIGRKIEMATDANILATENWGLNMEICDFINNTEEGGRDAIRAIRKRLQTEIAKNNTTVMYTLTVLETCVKNCDQRFKVLVCDKAFIMELVRLIGPKFDAPQVIQERILSLIQSWADAFRATAALQGVCEVYDELKNKGVEFPMTDLDSMAPIITPKRTVFNQPQDQPPAPITTETQTLRSNENATLAPISGPVAAGPDQLVKLRSELDIVNTNLTVMRDLLSQLTPGNENPEELNFLNELNSTCRQMQERIRELIPVITNDEVTYELLVINDESSSNQASKSDLLIDIDSKPSTLTDQLSNLKVESGSSNPAYIHDQAEIGLSSATNQKPTMMSDQEASEMEKWLNDQQGSGSSTEKNKKENDAL